MLDIRADVEIWPGYLEGIAPGVVSYIISLFRECVPGRAARNIRPSARKMMQASAEYFGRLRINGEVMTILNAALEFDRSYGLQAISIGLGLNLITQKHLIAGNVPISLVPKMAYGWTTATRLHFEHGDPQTIETKLRGFQN